MLVSRPAAANALAAAVNVNGLALTVKASYFGGAESGVGSGRLGHSETVVFDVGNESSDCRHRGKARGKRARSADRCGRYDLDHSCVESYSRQRIARQVRVHRQSTQTVRTEEAAAALAHFLIGIEHVDGGAKVSARSSRIGQAHRGVRSSCCIGIRKIIDLVRISGGVGGS